MAAKVIVLRAAGSNCDYETHYAFTAAGATADLVHVNRLVEGQIALQNYQILAIPGGFTYGDDISGGKILANELKYKLAEQLLAFHDAGKLILGICNGFQVLVKAGLLPQLDLQSSQTVTLTNNDSGKFEDRWVYLHICDSPCVFTKNMNTIVYYPVAHAEGKFIARDPSVLDALQKNRQIVFQYVTADGSKPDYPANPNGSQLDIAGICDPSGRIMGLMPHPERHFDPSNHPRWMRDGLAAEGDGAALFRNAVRYFD